MDRKSIIPEIKSQFTDAIIHVSDKSKTRIFMDITPESIVRIADYMFHNCCARFTTATAIDMTSHIEIHYHFTLDTINLCVTFRVKLNRKIPEIESLANTISGAEWIEREMYEFFGINFKNHPELKMLLLSDQWPHGVHPLRRDYKEWDPRVGRDRGRD